ncbi:DUF550 domain-containing protein [Enterobacter hormaechei]|uniref:DUF550 domain-containing protein n=1 Tax=Enterobacter hormaechei TaxID=158836 RepID=UPI001D017B91|nr:DUF550 domain-containing protein [Enterobacter hormaechei]
MSTITKEWLLKTIAELEEERDAVPGAVNEDAAMALAAMNIALASLEAEPIYQLWDEGYYDTQKETYDAVLNAVGTGVRGRIVYTAPPAPECLIRPVHPRISSEELDDETLEELIGFRRSTFEYHSQQGNKVQTIIHGVTLTAMLELRERRAAMLQGAEPVSQPYTLPDGYCIMPMKLTAENGAKCALAGEFSETKFISCPECFGDDECETCDGTGRIEISVPVSWTTIKDIWAKGVEHFAEAAPQQEVK